MRNEKTLSKCRQSHCIVCSWPHSDAAHIKTKGAGYPDSPWNLVAQCRNHHMEQHRIGWKDYLEKYPRAAKVLKDKGWSWETVHGKFVMFHDKIKEMHENR